MPDSNGVPPVNCERPGTRAARATPARTAWGSGAARRSDRRPQLVPPVRTCTYPRRAEISAFLAGVKSGDFDDPG